MVTFNLGNGNVFGTWWPKYAGLSHGGPETSQLVPTHNVTDLNQC